MSKLSDVHVNLLRVLREAVDPIFIDEIMRRLIKRGVDVHARTALVELDVLEAWSLVTSRGLEGAFALTTAGERALDAAMRAQLSRDLRAAGKAEFVAELDDAHISYPGKPEASGMSEATLLGVRGYEMAWFAENPAERSFIRRAVPGEFPPDVTAEWVRVIRLDARADRRAREPVVKVGDQWELWRGPVSRE